MSNNNSRSWIGWQGIVAEVPQEWSLSAISGDEKTGYFRAESPESESLEVKWSSAGPKIDLYSKLDAYLTDLKRKSRKRKVDFEYKIKSKEGGVLSFTWRGDRKGQGRMWRCDHCSRVLIAQVGGSLSSDINNLASLVLPTVMDHTEDDWRIWAINGMFVESPPGYELEKHRVTSGYIRLDFRRKSNRLTVERWLLANVALKSTSLTRWFKDRAGYELQPFRCTIEPVQFDEESGIQISGRRAGLRQLLKTAYEYLTLRRPASRVNGYAWVCEETNKIHSVQSIHTADEDVLDAVLERVICH